MDDEQGDASDRRRAARIPINTEFATMPSATFISDLSELGVFVHTPNPSPRGAKLRLRFTVLLDDPVIVEGEGRVVRQQFAPVSGMGIEFTELAPEMVLRINDVISRQRPRDSGPPLARDEDEDALDAASTLTRGSAEDPSETADTLRREDAEDSGTTAQTLRRENGPAGGSASTSGRFSLPGSSGKFRLPGSSGTFRPPQLPGADENAKTGIYPPVDADLDDPEAER
jgi:hypothetical protein